MRGSDHSEWADIESAPWYAGATEGLYYALSLDNLRYHESWDWLMSVIDKIEHIEWENTDEFCSFSQCFEVRVSWDEVRVVIDNDAGPRGTKIIDKDWAKAGRFITGYDNGSKLENAYKTVVGFVKWYKKYKV